MCSLDELLYALVTAMPGERVKVKQGELTKTSAVDGIERFPDYRSGVWIPRNGTPHNYNQSGVYRKDEHGNPIYLNATPMRVLARA